MNLPSIAIVERLRQTGDTQAADYIEWVRQWGDDWRKRAAELEEALNAADRFLPRYVQVGIFALPKDNEDYRAMAKVYKALGRYVPRSEPPDWAKEWVEKQNPPSHITPDALSGVSETHRTTEGE